MKTKKSEFCTQVLSYDVSAVLYLSSIEDPEAAGGEFAFLDRTEQQVIRPNSVKILPESEKIC